MLLLNIFFLTGYLLRLSSASKFGLNIPIYFDIPKHLGFLLPKTQFILDQKLSEYVLDIDYKTVCLLGKGPSYTVKLDYAMDEAYFISPHGKTLTIYQTDLLIAHNKIPEFIAQLIVDFVLVTELNYFDRNTPDKSDNVAIEMDSSYNVDVLIKAPTDYKWDNELFQQLFQPVIDELEDLIYLNVSINYIYEEDQKILNLDDIASPLNYDSLTLLIYLSSSGQKIYDFDSRSIIIPKKGAIQLYKVDGEIIEDMEQIEIMEVLTGQLFRLLGMKPTEPKSPFIRIDFMIRKQIYINYQKLNKEQREAINELLEKAKWGDALRLSWSYLKS